MDFSFSTNKLERQLSSEKEMNKAFNHVMPTLKRRLSVLRGAACLADVPHAKPDGRHQLFGNWDGHFAVWLTANYRLIFKPDHHPVPLQDDEGFDLHAITAIRIVAVEDYHGK